MDWETLYCPQRACPAYGLPWRQSPLVRNGSSHGSPQALCRACGQSVSLRYGTAYYDLQAETALFDTAIRALAEGNSLRGTARIVQIDKDTACAWLHRAASHCRLVMLYLWQDLHVTECQLDELWSFVHTKEAHLATAQRCCASYGDAWIWLAVAPLAELIVAFVVGERTQASADLLLERVAHVTDTTVPFFTSDQLAEYRTALLRVYGQWEQPIRQGSRGRRPLPRRVPHPDLVYVQVVKRRERGRVVEVSTQLVFGDARTVWITVTDSARSRTINTSFVERANLTMRQHTRRLTRKTNAFSKELPWLEKHLWLTLAYYHLVLPHGSLRQEQAVPRPTRGTGAAQRWVERTPAMAAGLTDHIWSMRELLSYRVPPVFLDKLAQLDHLFPALDPLHQGS